MKECDIDDGDGTGFREMLRSMLFQRPADVTLSFTWISLFSLSLGQASSSPILDSAIPVCCLE